MAQIKGKTYPMGLTNAVGSSVRSAAAVLASIIVKLTPTVINIPRNEDLKVLSIALSFLIVFFLTFL